MSWEREQIGDCMLYRGDALEILPMLPVVDLVVTDPPYGVDMDTAYSRIKPNMAWQVTHGAYQGKDYSKVYGDASPFSPEPILGKAHAFVLWGANFYREQLPASGSWLVWHKRDGLASNMFADGEMAWVSKAMPLRIFSHKWLGYMRSSEVGFHVHPTQKPVALMCWCLDFFPRSCSVLDPYMGCGPVGVAAVTRGQSFTGIEIERQYFDFACQRIEAASKQGDLFRPVGSPPPMQEVLWS
jgi:site-specific DNA-methyltransferase (adenine-specific)